MGLYQPTYHSRYESFVQSHFLKTLASVGSIGFLSLLLLNPNAYTNLVQEQRQVNANFLSNEYKPDFHVVNADQIMLSSGGDDDDGIQRRSSNTIQSYIVQRGDSLDQIAKKYSISVDQIKRVNNLIDNDIIAGQKFYITSMDGFVYTVQQESISLMVFANMYDLDLQELLKANNQTNELAPYKGGEAIFVPRMSLQKAYELSLLIKPEPRPEPVVQVVQAKPSTSNTASVSQAVASQKPATTTTTSAGGGSTSSIVSSYGFHNLGSVAGMAAGQCTSYAAYKAGFAFPQLPNGSRFRAFGGNGNQWYANARAAGFKTSATPTPGAIAVFQQGGRYYYGYGHVAIVEEVDRTNHRMKISEMNYAGIGVVTVRWVSLNDSMTQTLGGQSLLGFIPVQDLPAGVQARYNAARGY